MSTNTSSLGITRFVEMLWLLGIISIYIVPLKIYPFIFVLCILSVFAKNMLRLSLDYYHGSMFFLFIAVQGYFIHFRNSDGEQIIKLLINIVFMITVSKIIYSSFQKVAFRNALQYVIEIVILMSLIQVVFSVSTHSLWLSPFTIQNSSDAYFIQDTYLIIGDANKNIWATKILFLFIIYVIGHKYKYFYWRRYCGFVYIAYFVCQLYISSRAAQGVSIIFVLLLLIMAFKNIYYKVIAIAIAIIMMLFLFPLMMRVDFGGVLNYSNGDHGGDGFISRIILWDFIVRYIASLDIGAIMFGSGVMYTQKIFYGLFPENNPHNVFLNIFVDFGLVGVFTYFIILWSVFIGYRRRCDKKLIMILMVPFFIIINMQYLGYDSDVVIYMILSYAFLRNAGNKIEMVSPQNNGKKNVLDDAASLYVEDYITNVN